MLDTKLYRFASWIEWCNLFKNRTNIHGVIQEILFLPVLPTNRRWSYVSNIFRKMYDDLEENEDNLEKMHSVIVLIEQLSFHLVVLRYFCSNVLI